jgi:hypothetical protein
MVGRYWFAWGPRGPWPALLPVLALSLALLRTADAAADPLAPPLRGKSYDFAWDGRDIGHPERAWLGRAYVPPEAAEAKGPVALVVFLHGLNAALIKHRWMGGGDEGDVRRVVDRLVASGAIPPVVVAAPSSVVASEVSTGASWNHFDLDNFVDETVSRLSGMVSLDAARIVVAGHSGAGCSTAGGLATLGSAKRPLHAIVAIDTCMSPALAERLTSVAASTHVVVGYQTLGWRTRPFEAFRVTFERGRVAHPAAEGVLRTLIEFRPTRTPHDATVALALEQYLPQILGAATAR